MKKTALVTGGSRGIGKAIALELGHKGIDVIISYVRNKEDAEVVVSELTKMGRTACAIQADMEKVDDVLRLGDEAWNTFGRIDYLINNAGISLTRHILDCTLEDFESLNNVNFRGTFLLSQFIARKMIETQIEGSIYTVTSINAILPGVGKALYGATKGALETMMKGMALDLSPHSININTLVVGAIETDMTAAVIKDQDFLKRVEAGIPLSRLGKPEEVARVIVALLETGTYMTGSTITIDGGWLIKNGYANPEKYKP
jgi:NAD(P)-dependent dehydrogenase (short-subunit alcohol dehydrogenase family)